MGEIITNLVNDKQNWRGQFDAITHMRVLAKNFPEHVNSIFSTFGMPILDSMEGVKTCTLKNALLLMKEVFEFGQITSLNGIVIEKFVPILL